MQKKGYVSFVLHAHLPFIHHPESDDYLEESWLYEAISETYIPLLQSYQKLVDEGVNFRITMSITPTLLSMFDNKLLHVVLHMATFLFYMLMKKLLELKLLLEFKHMKDFSEENLVVFGYLNVAMFQKLINILKNLELNMQL